MMPLALAFVGDAVYELYIRSRILSDGNLTAGTLHKMAVKYVCAHSQAYAAEMLKDKLSEEETYIFKRGRNAWSPSLPKNCNVTEYRQATGLETLIGYLHLTGQKDRADQIMAFCVEQIDRKEEENEQEKRV
jgi:ribonuclease-3 family protein